MNVFCIASNENRDLAKKLIRDAMGNTYFTIKDEIEVANSKLLKRDLAETSAVFVAVDKSFNSNTSLNAELGAMTQIVDSDRIIVVRIGDGQIPVSLDSHSYLVYNDDNDYKRIVKLLTNSFSRIRNIDKDISFGEVQRNKVAKLFDSLSFIALGFTSTITSLLLTMPDLFDNKFFILPTVLGYVLLFETIFLSSLKKRRVEKQKTKERYLHHLRDSVSLEKHDFGSDENIASSEPKPELDALGRMLVNLEAIHEYYTWSQKQAKRSFVLAISACIGGFLLLVAAVILPIAFKLGFELSLIPAIGGAIAELIAATSLFVYRSSLTQLNHYHEALHEDERFLSSVNLLTKFSTQELKDEMLKQIIQSEIKMNLAGINVKNEDQEK